jgi:hypothetical protein
MPFEDLNLNSVEPLWIDHVAESEKYLLYSISDDVFVGAHSFSN